MRKVWGQKHLLAIGKVKFAARADGQRIRKRITFHMKEGIRPKVL
jgi:hypothetical protein